MLLAILLISADPVVSPVKTEAEDQEIVVVAQRFAKWRGVARSSKGEWRCKTRQPSGSKAIDAQSCTILIACIADESTRQGVGNIFADTKIKPPQASLDRVGLCLKERREAAVDAYVAAQRR